jgi:hypothetical protein
MGSQIHGYLMYNIRLGALDWFNIETGLLEDELLDKSVQKLPYCDDSSAINKMCHHLINRYNDSRCRYNVSGKQQTCQEIGQQGSKRC